MTYRCYTTLGSTGAALHNGQRPPEEILMSDEPEPEPETLPSGGG